MTNSGRPPAQPGTRAAVPTVWMNMSTSTRWKRPANGIVRVERRLEEELTGLLGPDRLKRFVAGGGRFRALPRPGRSSPPDDRIVAGDVILDAGMDWHRWGDDTTRHYESFRRRNGVRVVTFCHDVIPLIYPQYLRDRSAPAGFREFMQHQTRGSDVVLCVSKNTERDYLAFCEQAGLAAPRTEVVSLGDDVPEAAGEISDPVRDAAAGRYLLFVSTVEKRKNHEVIYRAYHRLAIAGFGAELPRVVFVGMTAGDTAELAHDLDDDPSVKGLFASLQHVNDAELNLLYRNAYFCVYPSLYEGWGLPIGEALSMGKFVLCSDRGPLHEVGGDLNRYLDPWHAQAWADAILDLVRHPEKVAAMEAAIRRDYRPRTWRDTAETVAGVIASL